MGRSCLLPGFVIFAVLFLSFSHGFGRVLIGNSEDKTQFAATFEVGEGKSREMMTLLDYETGPNVNTKGGLFPPPSQPAPAPLA